MLSNVGQNTKETNDPPEVTSPHKLAKLAQAHTTNEKQPVSQGITKAQGGKGQIKKLAREQGLNQGMDSKTQAPIIGLKRLSSQIFSESEEKAVRKKKFGGLAGSPCNEDISVAATL